MRTLLIMALLFVMAFTHIGYAEDWGDIDSQWLWKPFEAKEPFMLYSEPSKSSKKVGKVERGMWLKLLDMGSNGWSFLREWDPPHRKGWVDLSLLVTEDKLVPLCGEYVGGGEKAFLRGNPHLYHREDNMPFITVVADMEAEVGKVNDKIINLCALGYSIPEVYFLEPGHFPQSEGKEVYAICVGTYKDIDEAKKVKGDLENKGYQPLLYEIDYEYKVMELLESEESK